MRGTRMRILTALGAVCFCLAVPACGGGDATASSWQKTVDSLAALTQGLQVPDYLLQENAAKKGGEFDPNQYFSVLTHLSMQPGYVLDYVYSGDFLGGRPFLYARPADRPAYRTYAEYLDAVGDQAPATARYLDYVQVDSTPEGFFQLAVLASQGERFYLHWHANYNDAEVVCDRPTLEKILAALQEAGFAKPSASMLQQARALDTTPTVEFKADEVVVRVLIFTKWGGFIRQTYTIRREAPHTILDVTEETLVEYNCGIMF